MTALWRLCLGSGVALTLLDLCAAPCCVVQAFVRAAEKHGRGELDKIVGEIEGKAKDEVIAYSKVR